MKRAALRGTISNFYGVLYATSASEFDSYNTGFLQRAVDQFRKAIEQFDDAPEQATYLRQLRYEDPERESIILLLMRSYLPYENLANTYSMLGRSLMDGNAEVQSATQLSSLECQDRSLSFYQQALEKVNDMNPPLAENIERRIEISRATSRLLTGEPTQTQAAKEKVASIAGGDLAGERDVRILYSLACWYAVADEMDAEVPGAKDRSRLYLAYSLGRDKKRDLWQHASKDKDLASIGYEFVQRLELELMRQRLRNPDLPDMSNATFAQAISEAIEISASADTD